MLSLAFLLLTCKTVHGEVLLLPDLVIIRDSEPDIPPPNLFPDLAETWNPVPPRYRRQYRIPIEDYLKAPKSLPENLPVIDPTRGIDALSLELLGTLATTKLKSPKPGEWALSIVSDIQEGGDFGASGAFENLGEIGGQFFVPFPETSPRPWSGEFGWERNGLLSSSVKIGTKKGDDILPYSAAVLNWDRGINQPDNYFLELHHYGFSTCRISILGGIDLSFRFGESNWSIITKIEGGLSHTMSDTEGSGRGMLAIARDFSNYGLLGKIGVDVAYDGSEKIRAMPFLGFNWLIDDNISIYAHAEIFMRYPDNLVRIFRRERINSFEARIPIHSRYRFGIAQIENKRISYLFEMSYTEGAFCEAENGIVMNRDDKRVQGEVSIGYNFDNQRINLSGRLDFSLLGFTDIWEGRIELTNEKLSYYIFSGSQDAILAEFFGGFRSEEAIIGLGLNWEINENWNAGLSAYTRVPWDKPSLKLTLAWKSIGAADG